MSAPLPIRLFIGNAQVRSETLGAGDEIVVEDGKRTDMTIRWKGPTLEIRIRGHETGFPTR